MNPIDALKMRIEQLAARIEALEAEIKNVPHVTQLPPLANNPFAGPFFPSTTGSAPYRATPTEPNPD